MGMKAFISLDLEGLPYVVSREHLYVRGALYQEAREIATELVKTVAETLWEKVLRRSLLPTATGRW
jgi:D-amino peptidase